MLISTIVSQDQEENDEAIGLIDEMCANVASNHQQLVSKIQCLESRVQSLEGRFAPDCTFMNCEMLSQIPYNEGFDFAKITQFTIFRKKRQNHNSNEFDHTSIPLDLPTFKFVYQPILHKYIKVQEKYYEHVAWNSSEQIIQINRHLTDLKEIFILHENKFVYGSVELINTLMQIETVKNNTINKIIFDLDRPSDDVITRGSIIAIQDYYHSRCSFDFEPSATFNGSKHGFTFKVGEFGLGYYKDLNANLGCNEACYNNKLSYYIKCGVFEHNHHSVSDIYNCPVTFNIDNEINNRQTPDRCRERISVAIKFWENNIDKIYYCKARVPENRFPLESELIKYTDSEFFLPLI